MSQQPTQRPNTPSPLPVVRSDGSRGPTPPKEYTATVQEKLIRILGNDDANTLTEKDKSYGSSWRKRGGTGAHMMLARKWDRLEEICKQHNYDIFAAIEATKNSGDSSILEQIRDLRRYLFLVDAFMMHQTINPYNIHAVLELPGLTDDPPAEAVSPSPTHTLDVRKPNPDEIKITPELKEQIRSAKDEIIRPGTLIQHLNPYPIQVPLLVFGELGACCYSVRQQMGGGTEWQPTADQLREIQKTLFPQVEFGSPKKEVHSQTVESLRNKLKDMEAALSDHRVRNKVLRSELKIAKTLHVGLQNELDKARDEIGCMEAARDEQHANLLSEIKSLCTENETLKATQQHQYTPEVKSKDDEIARLNGIIESVTNERDAYKQDNERLKEGKWNKEECHNICHNLPNTVPLNEFARGCMQEIARLYDDVLYILVVSQEDEALALWVQDVVRVYRKHHPESTHEDLSDPPTKSSHEYVPAPGNPIAHRADEVSKALRGMITAAKDHHPTCACRVCIALDGWSVEDEARAIAEESTRPNPTPG